MTDAETLELARLRERLKLVQEDREKLQLAFDAVRTDNILLNRSLAELTQAVKSTPANQS